MLLRAGLPAIAAWLLIAISLFLPALDSAKIPSFDLTSAFSGLTYWLTESGGKYGATLVGILMLGLLVSREGIARQRRLRESGVILTIVLIFAGGGALFNEHLVKATLQVPRPNIIWLAGEDGSGPLEMTAEQFYASGDKPARSAILAKVLRTEPGPIPLSPAIESHWIEETGYSFPSGHAFSAMFFATFFLLIGASCLTGRRIWLFYALLPWALAVGYSRLILTVHTPMDITLGSFEGLALGFFAWVIVRRAMRILT